MSKRVVAAMSGGVDSSVAAALLVQQGYEVIGITLNVWPKLEPGPDIGLGASASLRKDACCSLSAVEDARRVADKLGIPHYVLNFREIFANKVIANFVEEYSRGRTPNPCIRCNEFVKFDALLAKAQGLGAELVATGHYVRLSFDPLGGRYVVRKSIDSTKDQSYVLYVLRQEQLARSLFPLGDMTKERTRQLADELGLPVANKPDSQEICFVPDNDYGRFLEASRPDIARPGPILDREGNVRGSHRGIVHYTVGQRRGLGIAAERPLYVTGLDTAQNAVIVGEEADLYAGALVAEDFNWLSIDRPSGLLMVSAKIRYRAREVPAVVRAGVSERVEVAFVEPQKAVAPGQAVVLYNGDLLLGGGTITSSVPGVAGGER